MPATEHHAASDSAATVASAGPLAGRQGSRGEGHERPSLLRHLSGPATGICIATAGLFLVSKLLQPESVSHSSLLGMLPFAAILAIAAIGQTLVVQQGGIDLSVPGMLSLTVIILTRYPNGDSGKLGAALALSLGAIIAAGLLSGFLVSWIGITPIVATLGMNALLYGGVIQISGGTPRTTTDALHNFASGKTAGVPNSVIVALIVTAIVAFVVKKTVVGRRFEAVGAGLIGARAAGLDARRNQMTAYVGAALMYWIAGVLLGGVVSTPSAFQGDSYLLPSVAAVVLGGTSLLGGRGSVVASAVAALFITQLDQFVLTSGAKDAVQNLVQAAALGAGIAIYSVPWRRLFGALRNVESAEARDKPTKGKGVPDVEKG
jgi:ribose transport system permease protein